MLKSKAVLFAEAFLFGQTRGDWAMSAEIAGYEEIPEKSNVHIAIALDKLQDKAGRVAVAEKIEKTTGPLDWSAAADEVAPVLIQIATGEVKATAAQKAAIELIINRGQGKVVEKQRKLESPGVVVLPALGEKEVAQVCPNCMSELIDKSNLVTK